MKLLIRRELLLFFLVGGLTVWIDFSSYRLLISHFTFDVDVAKGCAFLTGTLFAYVANRFWTFKNNDHKSGSIYRFIFLYAATLVINIVVNRILLSMLSNLFFIDYFAFISATFCSALLNFLGMKFFVFRESIVKELG